MHADKEGEAHAGLSAETAIPGFYILHPDGAVAPKGLSAITSGMSQEDVLGILEPLYDIRHSAAAWEDNPLVDYFTYEEGGIKKYGEIFYTGNRVGGIRFGYLEYLVIE